MKGCKEQSPGVLLQMLDLGGSHQLLGVPRLMPVGGALEPRPPEEVPRGGCWGHRWPDGLTPP